MPRGLSPDPSYAHFILPASRIQGSKFSPSMKSGLCMQQHRTLRSLSDPSLKRSRDDNNPRRKLPLNLIRATQSSSAEFRLQAEPVRKPTPSDSAIESWPLADSSLKINHPSTRWESSNVQAREPCHCSEASLLFPTMGGCQHYCHSWQLWFWEI